MPFVHFVATVGNVETVLSLLSLQPWNRWYPWNRDFVAIVGNVEAGLRQGLCMNVILHKKSELDCPYRLDKQMFFLHQGE